MRAMITNGGPHHPMKWAVMTAETIMPIDDSVEGERLIQAKKLQTAIAEVLTPHHDGVQQRERKGLREKAGDHLEAPFDPIPLAKAALTSIVATAKGTPWEVHFNKPEVQNVIGAIISGHFATAMDIERQTYADRMHTKCAKSRAYKAMRHPEQAVVAAQATEG